MYVQIRDLTLVASEFKVLFSQCIASLIYLNCNRTYIDSGQSNISCESAGAGNLARNTLKIT